MAIEDELYRAFTGRPRNSGEPLADMLSELHADMGSIRATARYIGAAPSTVSGWLHGRHPRPASATKIVAASRRYRLVANPPTNETVVIKAQDRTAGDERERTLTTRNLSLRDGTMDQARDAYLRGDDVGAARAFLAGIGDHWYREWLTPGSEAARTGVPGGMAAQGYGRGPAERGQWIAAQAGQADDSDDGAAPDEGDEADDDEWVSVDDEGLAYEGDDGGDSDYGANVVGVG